MYFPHPLTVRQDGLIAMGGDLQPERLLLAYRHGIFPWFNDGPPCWYFTHPRPVIIEDSLYISKSMRKLIRDQRWTVTMNTSFIAVITACANTNRKGQEGTWITDDIIASYTTLHQQGHAHSIEVWDGDDLVGGLYGMMTGRIFCGESMFSEVSNASKYGFLLFAQHLFACGGLLIDCQQDTPHMESLGSVLVRKEHYWGLLQDNMLVDNLSVGFSYSAEGETTIPQS